MTQRLFLAIPLSPHDRQILTDYTKAYSQPDIKWVPSENLHITLVFMGNVSETILPNLIEKITAASSQTHSFQLEFSKICLAPPSHTPTMIWAVYQNQPAFASLSKDLIVNLKELISLDNEKPDLIPHVTLARFKKHTLPKDFKLAPLNFSPLEVSSIILYCSQLRSDHAVYTEIQTFPLK